MSGNANSPAAATGGNKDLVRRLLDDCLNDGRLELIDDLIAVDYLQRNPSVQSGRAGVRALFELLRAAFPDLKVTIDEMVADNDEVVVLSTLRATHGCPLRGIAPTGRTIDVSSIDFYRIGGGKIVEHFGRFDELGMLEQLGIVHDLSWRGRG